MDAHGSLPFPGLGGRSQLQLPDTPRGPESFPVGFLDAPPPWHGLCQSWCRSPAGMHIGSDAHRMHSAIPFASQQISTFVGWPLLYLLQFKLYNVNYMISFGGHDDSLCTSNPGVRDILRHKLLAHLQGCHMNIMTVRLMRPNSQNELVCTPICRKKATHTQSQSHTCSELSYRIAMWNASGVQKNTSLHLSGKRAGNSRGGRPSTSYPRGNI